ncbi:MAG: hypothetical protein NC223_11560 [Butyrivibrio sp.]|nr:hypothetical protein [Butyrivibrio sp.]
MLSLAIAAAEEASSMSSFLSMIGEGASWIMTQAQSIGNTIVNTPVLAISLVVPILGGAIGIFVRLLRH